MPKYKCYTGNLDGRRKGFVMATSQKKAIEILETSRSDFQSYWQEIYLDEKPEGLDPDPDILYTKKICSHDEWVKGRCEL